MQGFEFPACKHGSCQEIPCIFLGSLLLCASLLERALTQLLFSAVLENRAISIPWLRG